MSFPHIPNVTPNISISVGETVPVLLASMAFEELALAHIINAEAEKIQFVLGTLNTQNILSSTVTVSNILDVNKEVQRTLRDVIKKEMLLEFKFENILELISIPPVPSPTTISLTAVPSVLCATGTGSPSQSILTGQVIINGNPAPVGTQVNFSVNNAALGTVLPNPAFTTDAFGNFTATFTATNGTGNVTITATLPDFPGITASVSITIIDCTPVSGCGCQATNMAGKDFNINRGTGSKPTTVTFNGVPQPSSAHGSVTYSGHICQDCQTDNAFVFEYGGSDTVAAFTFRADTFSVPHCPTGDVVITGQGTIISGTNVFGATPTYILTLSETTDDISVVISGNGNTFTASTTNVGEGELLVSDCP